jgi:hypothetical protein
LPASLTTSAGSYRPGSTSGSTVQSASHSTPVYGNTYTR